MIIFVYGDDTFRSRQYVLEQVEKFKKARDPAGYNTATIDGKKESLGKLLDVILASPFLAERRMVVVNNLLANSDKTLLAAIIERVAAQKFPATTAVLFWQGEPLSKVKEAKELQALLSKEKYAQEFETLTGIRLEQWLSELCKNRGGNIAPAAVRFLAENVGGDMWLASTTLSQLLAYTDGKRIERPDVELFLAKEDVTTIFNAVDAIAEGNHQKAFALLAGQRSEGQEEGFIFNMLVRQFKILLQIKDGLDRTSANPENLAQILGISPFVVKKSLGTVRRYSLGELQRRYRELMEIDRGMKTGLATQEILIDRFVAAG